VEQPKKKLGRRPSRYKVVVDEGPIGFEPGPNITEMDGRFQAAMRAALAAGAEHAPTSVSTAAGTRRPTVGYTRPD
jgi:hypothetical protein